MNNLYEKFKNASQKKLNNSLVEACRSGSLEIVKYLLTSPELKIHADIHYNDGGSALEIACLSGSLPIVEFLLTSHELKDKPDIHGTTEERKNDYPFKFAVASDSLDVIKFLIFDMNIEKTSSIDEYLKKVEAKKVEAWFELRDLNNSLKTELPDEKTEQKKPKL